MRFPLSFLKQTDTHRTTHPPDSFSFIFKGRKRKQKHLSFKHLFCQRMNINVRKMICLKKYDKGRKKYICKRKLGNLRKTIEDDINGNGNVISIEIILSKQINNKWMSKWVNEWMNQRIN